MTVATALVVDVAELRRRTGSRRVLADEIALPDMRVGDRWIVDDRLDVDVTVVATPEGVTAHGTISGRWRVACRRCLEIVEAPMEVEVREFFEADPTEGETWPVADERIDLADPVREAALLAIPLAPVCRVDCAGPEPDRFPTAGVAERSTGTSVADSAEGAATSGTRGDPRWAALDELRFDEDPA